jgi:cytochrome c biogenesis protein ResB
VRNQKYSKTLESIQVDQPFREAGITVFGPEYEYEYEKNQWWELPATIMPEGPQSLRNAGSVAKKRKLPKNGVL